VNEGLLQQYAEVVGEPAIEHLRRLAEPLEGLRVVHVNSTRDGGGVAEILQKLIPLKQALGIDVRWEVIPGNPEFFRCTKAMHNALQGNRIEIPERLLQVYDDVNAEYAASARTTFEDADVVIVHDPQPAGLRMHFDGRARWVWRCHIDVSRPYLRVWRFLRSKVAGYDASIFHLPDFSQRLPHPQFLIPPSIDPLSEKNVDLSDEEVAEVRERFGLDPDKPLAVQISRFDRFKDPVGVIEACRMARRMTPLQLVLAGGGASDDPEGESFLEEVRAAAEGDEDTHVLMLPSGANRTVNALQRAADIIMQKSLREGFGLTVTEGMWKGRPVIGGDVGGIQLQVIDHFTGFRVRTPEGAALRLRYLLHESERRLRMGERARRMVRDNFLITRHLKEYLALMHSVLRDVEDRVEVASG
jgi:trehalose synthase